VKVLFDQGTPVPLRRALSGHAVDTAYERGWSELANGALLRMAEDAGYEVLVTTDRNLRYQQNLADRKIALVVLSTTSWPRISPLADRVVQVLDAALPGTYVEVMFD
jgi:hypothetical protein